MKIKFCLAALASTVVISFTGPSLAVDNTQPSEANSPSANTTSTETAPVPGANSFTEAQAKSRIEDAGYSNVSDLAKDQNGIWRGQANKDGKSLAVALDYKGNVVATAQ
jgi:putative membrane protein